MKLMLTFQASSMLLARCQLPSLLKTAPDTGRLVQPEGYIIGFHQQAQVVIDTVGTHDAEFRSIVPLRQVDAAVGVDVVEIRSRAVQAAARMTRDVQLSLDVGAILGALVPL